MKRTRLFQVASFLMMALFCATIVSCGDDDENDAGGNNGGSGGNTNIPNNVLTSRLTDKDGNRVFLAGIKYENSDEWRLKFEYDQSGNLVSLTVSDNMFNVNGLNITGQEIDDDGDYDDADIDTFDFQLKLNEAGLISGYSGTQKDYWRATGNLEETDSGTASFSYDEDCQLIEAKGNSYKEKYDKDGTLKERKEEQVEIVYIWSEGNMRSRKIVKREKENDVWTEKKGLEDYIEYHYGSEMNVTRQPENRNFGILFEGLEYLGLFGVGSKNFAEKTTYNLNSNGTIDTKGSYKYIYK